MAVYLRSKITGLVGEFPDAYLNGDIPAINENYTQVSQAEFVGNPAPVLPVLDVTNEGKSK